MDVPAVKKERWDGSVWVEVDGLNAVINQSSSPILPSSKWDFVVPPFPSDYRVSVLVKRESGEEGEFEQLTGVVVEKLEDE